MDKKDYTIEGLKNWEYDIKIRNKDEEKTILNKCEQIGLKWSDGQTATNYIPSEDSDEMDCFSFPYILTTDINNRLTWRNLYEIITIDNLKIN